MARSRSRRRSPKRSQRTDDYIGVRLPPELRARVMELAALAGVTTSEWIRTALAMAADSPTLEDQGYVAGRQLGLAVANARIQQAMSDLPSSFEEAQAQHGEDS